MDEEYNVNDLKETTVSKYFELQNTGNEDDYNTASEAMSNIILYLYSNVDSVDELEIEDADINNNMVLMMLVKFKTECEDYPIIQCDADDFICQDIEVEFDDVIELEVTKDMTFMEIAEKMKDKIDSTAESELDNAAESAAEDYGPHRSYWWSR